MADNNALYTPGVLMGVVRFIQPPKTFLRNTFVKGVYTSDTEEVKFDLVKGGRKMAPFVSPMHEGKIMQRMGYTTKTVKPAYVKPKRTITPGNAMVRLPGEAPFNSEVTPVQRAMAILGQDLADMEDAIIRREEWMIAQGLFTGGIHVLGEGVDYHVNFDIQTVMPAAGQEWNDPAVTGGMIVRQLNGWADLPTDEGSVAPNVVIMSKDVWEAIADKLIEYLDTRKLDLGDLAFTKLPNGAKYIGRIKETGLDLYTYGETYIDDITGNVMPMVPAGTILLASTEVDASMLYGAILDVDVLRAMPRYAKSWTQEDPSMRFVMLQSAPMFNPMDVGSYIIGKPLKA